MILDEIYHHLSPQASTISANNLGGTGRGPYPSRVGCLPGQSDDEMAGTGLYSTGFERYAAKEAPETIGALHQATIKSRATARAALLEADEARTAARPLRSPEELYSYIVQLLKL